MTLKNTGTKYEQFVAELQQAVIDSDKLASHKNIDIQTNVKLTDQNGIKRQFDVYWEYEIAGTTYKTVIECKDYNQKISVEKIDALLGKISDLPQINKALFATKLGYQKGAKTKAERHNIDLLLVRKQNATDWTSSDGTPYLKEIVLNMHFCPAARVLKFVPILNIEWAKENTNLDISKPITWNAPTNEVIIKNIITNESQSLHEIFNKLPRNGSDNLGEYEKQEMFEDAYISFNSLTLKLDGYKIKYLVTPKLTSEIKIDFSDKLIGVIEYLSNNEKISIFEDIVQRESWNF